MALGQMRHTRIFLQSANAVCQPAGVPVHVVLLGGASVGRLVHHGQRNDGQRRLRQGTQGPPMPRVIYVCCCLYLSVCCEDVS